jgi:hypothetical protein
VSAIRLLTGTVLPKKQSLNCTMPELVNSSVGSFLSTNGAEGTILCPLFSKKSRNFCRIEAAFITSEVILAFIAIDFIYIYGFKTCLNHKINPNWDDNEGNQLK